MDSYYAWTLDNNEERSAANKSPCRNSCWKQITMWKDQLGTGYPVENSARSKSPVEISATNKSPCRKISWKKVTYRETNHSEKSSATNNENFSYSSLM